MPIVKFKLSLQVFDIILNLEFTNKTKILIYENLFYNLSKTFSQVLIVYRNSYIYVLENF